AWRPTKRTHRWNVDPQGPANGTATDHLPRVRTEEQVAMSSRSHPALGDSLDDLCRPAGNGIVFAHASLELDEGATHQRFLRASDHVTHAALKLLSSFRPGPGTFVNHVRGHAPRQLLAHVFERLVLPQQHDSLERASPPCLQDNVEQVLYIVR